jgi:hypothetical protein
MKIIITENRINKLKHLVKSNGVKYVSEQMGGFDTFCKVLNIEGPMDFLHLFDDLEVVQSEEKENFILYRYTPGKNIMIYNTTENRVGISNEEILKFVTNSDLFGSSPEFKPKEIIQTWLNEVYNIDVGINKIHVITLWDNVSGIE